MSHEKLEEIATNIDNFYSYFKNNYKRAEMFRRMCAETTISDNQRAFLATLGRPEVEFNLMGAQVDTLLGEFTKIEPVVSVMQSTDASRKVDGVVVNLAEAHLSHVMTEANRDGEGKRIYKDILTGGWGVGRVYTDYTHAFSVQQSIYLCRENPLMCGFDPMAVDASKGDGQYCFKVYPMRAKDFKHQYPDADVDKIRGTKNFGAFQWSLADLRGDPIIVVCEYFERVKKRVRIVELSTGEVVRENDYKKLLEKWDSFAVPPIVVGRARWTTYDEIYRYEVCNGCVLKKSKTDWKFLPLVFFDGNSEMLVQEGSGSEYQFTKPVVLPLLGTQDLKNAAGQSLLNALDNMVQSKFVVKKEAIPQEQDYIDSITNIQRVGTVVVNAYSENNPDKPIPEPIRELTQTPAPPEVMGAFMAADQTAQTVMGGFSSNLGKQSNDLSGKAILEAAAIDGMAKLPYLDGYLKGLEWCARIMLDLFPKYILGERMLPVRMRDGIRDSVRINSNGKTFDYDEYALDLAIKSEFNNETQQVRALQQITSMAQAMPKFGEFMNSDVGMPILIRNMTIRDSDELLEGFKVWAQQQAQMMQEMAQRPTPEMLLGQAELIKAQAKDKEVDFMSQYRMAQASNESAKVGIEQQRVDNETIETEIKVSDDIVDKALDREKDKAEIVEKNLNNALKLQEIHTKKESKK